MTPGMGEREVSRRIDQVLGRLTEMVDELEDDLVLLFASDRLAEVGDRVTLGGRDGEVVVLTVSVQRPEASNG